MNDRWYEKVNWERAWAIFFGLCLGSFGIMIMLVTTKTADIPWLIVCMPLLIAMTVPVLIFAVAMILEYFVGDKESDRRE